jgi:cellobiose phosphorylase
LSEAIDRHAWDGDWYLRAFYDDGTPLGSARDDECASIQLSQSRAVSCRRRRSDAGAAGDGGRSTGHLG